MKWINVKDELPPFDVEVLISWDEEVSIGMVELGPNAQGKGEHWWHDNHYLTWEVEHWMTLPKAPPKGD